MPGTNPLGKVPALCLDDGRVVYDSKVIVEYLETLGRPPQLIPADPRLRIAHKQIEALADGVCDAAVLAVLERSRPGDLQSGDWIGRQTRKIEGGTAELARLLGPASGSPRPASGSPISPRAARSAISICVSPNSTGVAAIARCGLAARLDERPSFAATRPAAQPVATGR